MDAVEKILQVVVNRTVSLEELKIWQGGRYGYPGAIGDAFTLVNRQRLDSFSIFKERAKFFPGNEGRPNRFRPVADFVRDQVLGRPRQTAGHPEVLEVLEPREIQPGE